MRREKVYYKVWIRCTNCNTVTATEVPIGKIANEFLKEMLCDYCACKTCVSTGRYKC